MTVQQAPKSGNPPPEPSGKPLLWVAVALVVVAMAILVGLLLPRDAARRAPGTEPLVPAGAALAAPPPGALPDRPNPAPSSAPRAGAGTAVPAPLPPLDLFEGESIELLRMGREVTTRGAPLNSARLKEIYQFGKDHPGDARAHLLMGADAMNRDWFGFAVDHYVRAQKEDPRARQDPRMLRDLTRLAGSEKFADQSGKAIREIYGSQGTSAVEDAIAEAGGKGDLARVERLTALARSLSGPPAVR